jgi:hypothetical protein
MPGRVLICPERELSQLAAPRQHQKVSVFKRVTGPHAADWGQSALRKGKLGRGREPLRDGLKIHFKINF